MAMVLKAEGGFIQSWATHADADWATNTNEYMFGPFNERGFEWKMLKKVDGAVEVDVSGPFGQSFHVDQIAAIPANPGTEKPGKRVNLMIEWKEGVMRVRLNMVAVATVELAPA